MKCLRYIFVLLAVMLLATACSEDALVQSGTAPEGTPITLRFVAEVPKHCPATRGVSDIENLTLLVFDENHRYLYRATAVLGAVVPTSPSDVVRPDGGVAGGINDPAPAEKREITVTLLSSPAKKRIIHFVANYDFSSVAPDYKLEHMDESELMLSLYQEGEKPESYWQVFDFPTLGENSFANMQFRLLRNQAKIVVKNATSNFTLLGYCINNAPNKGTIAPFAKRTVRGTDAYNDPNGIYDDVLYLFPRDPKASTLLPEYSLSPKGYAPQSGLALSNKSPLFVYEYNNSEADEDRQMAIIVYGQMEGKNPAYYKIDLAQVLTDTDGRYLGKQPYDIVRNFAYLATINKVNDEGYATYEEAVKSPAGNNLFASIELMHYGTVSNGSYALVVDNTDALMTLPGRYESHISFTDAANINHPEYVRVYLDGKECKGAIADDEHITYAHYNTTNGGLYINIKAIPKHTERKLNFTIIGRSPDGNYMQRNLQLLLHPRYHFYAKIADQGITSNPQNEKVALTFTIPGTLHENLFPYSVYIAADYLSPYVDAYTNDALKVVRRGDRIFYEYVVKEKPSAERDVQRTLYFKRTLSDKSCVVTLISDYYLDADVLLPERASVNGGGKVPLYYTGLSYTEPRIFASRLRTTLQAEVVSGYPDVPIVSMASAGYLQMAFTYPNYGTSARIKLTATMHHAGGDVVCTKTMTKAEWIAALNNTATDARVVMDIEQIKVKGAMHLVDWRTNLEQYKRRGAVPVPTTLTNLSITSTKGSPTAELNVPETGKYEFTVSNLSTIKEPVSYQIVFGAKPADGEHATFTSNSIYLGKLLENPDISISE